jgi:hypothetical protein
MARIMGLKHELKLEIKRIYDVYSSHNNRLNQYWEGYVDGLYSIILQIKEEENAKKHKSNNG